MHTHAHACTHVRMHAHTCTHTSVVMTAICEGVMAPEITFCLRLGLQRSPRLATRLLTFILYLLPVSINSEKISEHQLRKMVSKRTETIDLTLRKLYCSCITIDYNLCVMLVCVQYLVSVCTREFTESQVNCPCPFGHHFS